MNIGIIAVNEAVRDYEEAVICMIAETFEKEGVHITNYPYHFQNDSPDAVNRLIDEATAKSDRLILITDVVARGSAAFSQAVSEIGHRRIWPIVLVTHIEDEEAMKEKTPWFATTITRKWMPVPFCPYIPSYRMFSLNFRTLQIYDESVETLEVDMRYFIDTVKRYCTGDGMPTRS